MKQAGHRGGFTAAEKKRWVETMPVLAGIVRKPVAGIGEFHRSTEFGDLYLDMKEKGAYYTLVKEPHG